MKTLRIICLVIFIINTILHLVRWIAEKDGKDLQSFMGWFCASVWCAMSYNTDML